MSKVTKVSFSLEVEGGNQALVDDPHQELKRILTHYAKRLDNELAEGEYGVHDLNGNRVGRVWFELETDGEEE